MTARIFEKIAIWREKNAIESELYSLDDRQLNDIGIGRGQIPMIARASVAH